MVIDGGFAKAYHDTTGIAGYTLVYHSRGFQLVQHEPFSSTEEAIKNGTDIVEYDTDCRTNQSSYASKETPIKVMNCQLRLTN